MLLISLALSVLLSGYDQYIFACTSGGDAEKFCHCQAETLKKRLSDSELETLAKAGAQAMSGNKTAIYEVMEKHPKIVVALKKLEEQAASCR